VIRKIADFSLENRRSPATQTCNVSRFSANVSRKKRRARTY